MSENVNSAPAPVQASAPVESSAEENEIIEEGLESSPSKEDNKVASKSKEEKPSSKKKFKYKADNEEIEEEIDLADEEDLKKRLGLSKVAHKRMQEYANLRKQVEEFIDFAKKNPKALLKEVGYDPDQFAEEIMNERIENSKKSPEQLEREQLAKELEALRKQRDEEKTARERAEFEQLKAVEAQKLDETMTEALSSGGLPKSPYTVKRMADYMLLAAQNGVDLDASDIVPLIKREMQLDMKDFFSSSPDDLVEELITKERIANIRKKHIAKTKEQSQIQTASQVKATGQSSKSSDKPAVKKQTVRDWLRNG